jgi:hypothetical protein
MLCLGALLWTAPGESQEAKQSGPTPPLSKFASGEQLVAEVDLLVASAEKAVADDEAFKQAGENRQREASGLTSILLALALDDQENRYRAAAAGAVPAAAALASAEKLSDAKQALAKLKDLLAKPAADAEKPAWKSVASLGSVMHYTDSRFNLLKRGLAGNRFKARAADNARSAAVLAAIAAACREDEDYSDTPENKAKWQALSVEWRDAAAAVAAAVKAGDQAAALEQFKRLDKNCNDCHKAFEIEIK